MTDLHSLGILAQTGRALESHLSKPQTSPPSRLARQVPRRVDRRRDASPARTLRHCPRRPPFMPPRNEPPRTSDAQLGEPCGRRALYPRGGLAAGRCVAAVASAPGRASSPCENDPMCFFNLFRYLFLVIPRGAVPAQGAYNGVDLGDRRRQSSWIAILFTDQD